ncbi:MAG: bacteriohemerythrin [Candidatus Polarisedimenticolaceae bacterium]|nr:bacteriohemerythrin [Candidatus Polarisedimenticolaceae bacterium]
MKLLLQAMAFGILLIAVILTFGSFGVFHPVPWFLFAALIGIPVINNKMEERRYITWKAKYNTGIKDVDTEHMALINLINRLQLAVRYHQGECFEQEALEELVEYTATHFRREEKLMLAHDYPAYKYHKELHDEMTRDVMTHVARFKDEGHTALVDLAPIIAKWLTNHICVEDQAFAEYYLEKEQNKETEQQKVTA